MNIFRSASFLFFCNICDLAPAQVEAQGLFDSDQVLQIRLSGDIRSLTRNRSEASPSFPMTLSYQGQDSILISIPVKARTRGHFRLTSGNCTYPPIRLDFPKTNKSSSLFQNQSKMKLVTPCSGDQYVVREYLVYKLYNLITPNSFRARLVKVIYDDTIRNKPSKPLFGILLEEDDQMAKRNNTVLIEEKSFKPQQTKLDEFLKMAVFEYLIGNTDWSIQYYQNVKLIAHDSVSVPTPVPYDFDHAGIVGAPYAKPAEQLNLSSIRTRRYRGFCMPLQKFEATFEIYRKLKDDIYRLYAEAPWLEPGYRESTRKYLDEFYATINNPKSAEAEFGYPCDPNGTGNVVIIGLAK